MAETSSLSFEKCVLWKTRLPSELDVVPSTSPSFLVQDSEWHLELSSIPYPFRNSLYGYDVSLSRIYGEDVKREFPIENTFEVSTFMQIGHHILSQENALHNRLVSWECTSIALFQESSIRESCPDSGYQKDVVIICRFRLPASDVSCQNEKFEVTTQTDLDGSLIVRNLHDVKLSSDASLDSLSVDLAKLLEDKLVPDVSLRCGDRTVAAHKAILAARSPVFSAMFQSKMSESETGVVDITDVDADVLEMFLKYVYSGRLSDLPDESLPSLYAAGDKYDVSALKKECSARMINNLSGENCLNCLLLANAHSDQDFKNASLDFILNQMDILKSQEWAEFSQKNHILSIEVYHFIFITSAKHF